MSQTAPGFEKLGFAKTFVLPALLVFLVPIIALLFFYHAQATFDAKFRASVLQQVAADKSLSDEERKAAVAFFTETPFSQIVTNPQAAGMVDADTRFHYATFRWMIRLSLGSIIAGVLVFVLGGVCVLFSSRSQLAQYWSLVAGWHVLRIYSALQTIVIGILVVALSFWVTALWMNIYIVKLILIAALLALVGVGAVIMAIFKNPRQENTVAGTVLVPDSGSRLWHELSAICTQVGTTPPDQVIAGIDDNFFVTEQPITVAGQQYQGKTLFVSLSLLKQLSSAEAAAVLAHEMAHFSGQDTVYSKKITPLLMRYGAYLQELNGNVAASPVFHLMVCFRALFELSLQKLSRQREFRADAIAAQTVSPRDIAGALLRISAYSKFRGQVQSELFQQEQALETVDVAARIERGFPAFCVAFAAEPDIGETETAHPFDSHPPLAQRLSAVGVELSAEQTATLLSIPGDGGWRRNIPNADELERQQWQEFEELFRNYHEQSLAYRYLPETDEEQAVVVKTFPELVFTGKNGTLAIDFEKIRFATWVDGIHYDEITQNTLDDNWILQIFYERQGSRSRSIEVKKFPSHQRQEILNAFQNYYGRYLAAAEYKKQTQSAAASADDQAPSDLPAE